MWIWSKTSYFVLLYLIAKYGWKPCYVVLLYLIVKLGWNPIICCWACFIECNMICLMGRGISIQNHVFCVLFEKKIILYESWCLAANVHRIVMALSKDTFYQFFSVLWHKPCFIGVQEQILPQVKDSKVKHLLHIRAKLSFPNSFTHQYNSFRPKENWSKENLRIYRCESII